MKPQHILYFMLTATMLIGQQNNQSIFYQVKYEMNEDEFPAGLEAMGSNSSVLSSIGGLDVTKYAVALSDHMVKSLKKELAIAYFKKFQDKFNDPSQLDFATLFPNTKSTFLRIGEEIYDYNKFIVGLRQNFKSDFEEIPLNMPKILDNHADFFRENNKEKSMILLASRLLTGLKESEHPGEILKNIDANMYEGFAPEVQHSFVFLKLMSEAFKETLDPQTKSYWIKKSTIKEKLQDVIFMEGFKSTFLNAIDDETLKSKISNISIPSLVDFINKLIDETEKINDLLVQNKSQDTNINSVSQYVNTITNLLKLIEDGHKAITGSEIKDEYKKISAVLSLSSKIVRNITEGSHASALLNVVDLYSLFLGNGSLDNDEVKKDDIEKSVQALVNLVRKGTSNKIDEMEILKNIAQLSTDDFIKKHSAFANYLKEIKEIKSKYEEVKSTTIIKTLVDYGNFAAAMIDANSSEDIQAVIESHALPARSYRIKRKSKFNLALNGYIGLSYGIEKKASGDDLQEFRVTCPLGLSFSTSSHNWSFSLFTSIIDIGAISSFRFNQQENEVSTIYLKEIISPGAFIAFGIPKSPFSINLGLQSMPLLRKVENTGNTVEIDRNLRYSISILVDVPLFTLHNVK